MDEFSHTKYIHIISTQMKKCALQKHLMSSPRPNPFAFFQIETASVRCAPCLTSFTQAMFVRYKLLYEFDII